MVVNKFLDDLKGMDDRKIQNPESTVLEQMIDTCKEIFQFPEIINPNFLKIEELLPIYDKMLDHVKSKNLDFSYEDLQHYIEANLEQDLSAKGEKLLGMYTGTLLQILTENYEKQKKPTKFKFNGKKQRFRFLFALTKYFDKVIVEEFVGAGICMGMAANGKGDTVLLNYNHAPHACQYTASHQGKLNNLIILNNLDDRAGSGFCDEGGKIDKIYIQNCRGREIASMTANFDWNDFEVNNLYLIGNKGDELGINICFETSNIKNVYAFHNIGDKLLFGAGHIGTIDNVYLVGNKSDKALNHSLSGGSECKQILVADHKGKNICENLTAGFTDEYDDYEEEPNGDIDLLYLYNNEENPVNPNVKKVVNMDKNQYKEKLEKIKYKETMAFAHVIQEFSRIRKYDDLLMVVDFI
ncbi:hypothetical protein ACFL1H_08005 [Nanoarchaeota archaeon]